MSLIMVKNDRNNKVVINTDRIAFIEEESFGCKIKLDTNTKVTVEGEFDDILGVLPQVTNLIKEPELPEVLDADTDASEEESEERQGKDVSEACHRAEETGTPDRVGPEDEARPVSGPQPVSVEEQKAESAPVERSVPQQKAQLQTDERGDSEVVQESTGTDLPKPVL